MSMNHFRQRVLCKGLGGHSEGLRNFLKQPSSFTLLALSEFSTGVPFKPPVWESRNPTLVKVDEGSLSKNLRIVITRGFSASGLRNDKNTETRDEGKPAGSQDAVHGSRFRGGPVSWLSLALLIVTGAGILAYYDNEKKKRVMVFRQGPQVGKAAIGGPFQLLSHTGKPMSDKDFKGQWSLVYFGFTNCPDICPAEMEKMTEALNKLEKEHGLKVTPIFISVDPERDGVEQVKDYIKNYHPRMVGLTGTSEEIKQVAKAYRVYYMKTEDEGDAYLVDHSIIMYLMDPDMEFVKFFGKNNDVDMLTKGIADEIRGSTRA